MQLRPTAITVLAALFWLAGAVNVIGALQNFGHLPAFDAAGGAELLDNQLDGWLLAAMAIISLFLAGGLWAVHPWAKRVVVVAAALNLIVTLIAQFEGSQSWVAIVPGLVINLGILMYVRSHETRAALDG